MTAVDLTASLRRAAIYRVTGQLHPGGLVSVSLFLRDAEGAPCAVTGEGDTIDGAILFGAGRVREGHEMAATAKLLDAAVRS